MNSEETLDQTKQRVFLNMPKATGRLREIQLAENHILQRVKKICDENGLECFLMGGTLLGALRHKGFIPWDNDIDVGMMKKDFLQLQQILEKDNELVLKAYYKYQDGIKVTKVKYRATEVFWIDIFVFDYVDIKDDNVESFWKESCRINSIYREKLAEAAAPYTSGRPQCRPTANPELDAKEAVIEQEIAKTFPYYGKGNYITETLDSPYWSRDPRGVVPTDLYLPLKRDHLEFEGMKYSVWNQYEKALTIFYGDYWKLPFSVSEPHTTEFDEGFGEAVNYLKSKGII